MRRIGGNFAGTTTKCLASFFLNGDAGEASARYWMSWAEMFGQGPGMFGTSKIANLPMRQVPGATKVALEQAWLKMRGRAGKLPVNAGAKLPPREVPNFTGRAQRIVFGEGEVLYGIRDPGSRRLWWTRTKPVGEWKWRLDYAVLPAWNEGSLVETLVVPRGQSIIGFEGAAARQGLFPGGGSQIYMPDVPSGWSILKPWP